MTNITWSETAAEVLDAAALRIRELAVASMRWRGSFSAAVSVRAESHGLFDRLAETPGALEHALLSQVDERMSGPRDWDIVMDRLGRPLQIPSDRLLPLPSDESTIDDDLVGFAARLDRLLGQRFAFDVAQLVLGADGSVGALTAEGSAVDSPRRLDVNRDPRGPTRVGLTFASLQRCRTIVIVAIGGEKAEHVRHLADLDGRGPASQLRHQRIEVFADEPACQFLDRPPSF